MLDRQPQAPLPDAPIAPVEPHVFEVHGTRVQDDYAWLKAENWKEVLKDPRALPARIRSYLEAENAYAAAVLERPTEDLRKRLVAEMRGRIKEDDASVPQPDGPFAYFTRHREGGQHPLVCRQPRDGGPESILLDGDKEGEGLAFFDLGGAARRVRVLPPPARGRAAPPRVPTAPRRRPREHPARRRQGRRGPCVLRPRRSRALPGPPPDRVERRYQGLRIFRHPGPRSRHR